MSSEDLPLAAVVVQRQIVHGKTLDQIADETTRRTLQGWGSGEITCEREPQEIDSALGQEQTFQVDFVRRVVTLHGKPVAWIPLA